MSDDHVLVTRPTKQVWERVNCQINQPPYEDIQEHDEHGSFRVAFQDRHGDGYYQSENDTVVVPTRDLSTGLIRKLVYHELIHRGQSYTPLLLHEYKQIRSNVRESGYYYGNRCEQMAHAGADVWFALQILQEKQWPLRRLAVVIEESPRDALRDRIGLWNNFKFEFQTENLDWFAGYWRYVQEYWSPATSEKC